MKNYKFNNFSIVLVGILFASCNTSFLNAVEGYVITGATQDGNTYNGSNGNSNNIVKIDKGDTTGQKKFEVDTKGWVNGGNGDTNGDDVVNNTLKVTDIDYANYPAYRGGYISGGSGSVLNNSILVENSYFRGVYGGLINNNNNGKKANYNTVKVIKGTVNSANNSAANFRAGSIENGSGDSEYNTLEISDSTIQAPETQYINISSGLLQNGSGNSRYNQIIISGAKTTIDRSVYNEERNVIFGGRIQNPKATDQEIVGNRAYIQNLEYINGSIVAGGSANNSGGSGVTLKDNIAVISGDTKIKNAYGSWVKGLNNANLLNNLIIVNLTPNESSAKISGNVYGSLNEAKNGGTSENSAVYFMNGTVGGIVGGGNLANTGNKLILGDSSSNFGERKAGAITGFESINFNVLKAGGDAVLNLTGDKGSDLNNTEIKFLQTTLNTDTVRIRVGGENNSTLGITNRGDGSGGAKAIEALTKNTVSYNAKTLDKISVVTGGAKANNDIDENLTREDGSSQANYGIGDTLNYTYDNTTVDLTKPGKYYLIKSKENLENYDKIKIAEPQNEKRKGDKIKYENNQQIELEIVDAYQPDQVYRILDANTYTRNLRGMFVEDNKSLLITGTDSIVEDWSDKEFGDYNINNDGEFNRFNQPTNMGNKIYIEANAGDLGGKTIYGGYSDNNDTSNNNIYINQGANLSNATIIGGYSKSGKVSNNTVDLNNTSVTADITLAQTDNGNIDIATNKLINADNQKITGSLTVAKSDSANLDTTVTYTMPENIEITEDFILANSDSGKVLNNTLDITNATAKNIYVGKTNSGEASNNTINIKGDKVDGNIYVGYSQSGATNSNIANFEKGEVTGTIYGGNNGTENTLNVNSTTLKAGNVANFQVINFDNSNNKLASTTDVASSALILSSANDDTNLDGVEIWLNGNKYSSNSDYGLSANQKYYLIAHENKANVNYKKLENYAYAYGAVEKTIGDGSVAIDVTQSDQNYRIIDSQTYTRNLRGMFADATAQKNIYIIANSEIKENIGSSIGDDVFEKFGKSKTGNTVTIDPDDKNSDLDLSNTAIGGSDSTGNTLNVGKDNTNPIKMNKIKISNVTNFDTINMYLPDPKPNETVIEIKDGSNTDVSMSNLNVFINDVSKFTSGKIHLLKADNGQVISDPNSVKVKAQIGAIATAETNSLDLVYKGGSGGTSTNDQTKIFSEARLGGLGALWQGQYLIANHLDRVIPDAFSELFPYAITEGYDKRFNTGSHVNTRGFNANAGFASKGTNSNGEFTMGPFLDYGFSNYDAYLDDGTHGDGKNYYIGGGFFGKQENNSGSYFEATFRIGQLVTEFNGDLTLNGVRENYDFDLKSTYYAFHAGLGKIYDLNANNNLDIYGRFFYTHIESADTTLNGTKTEFDAVQSKKIRLGFKDDYKFNQNHAIYAGAAYEYEFDSKAGGRVLVLGSNAEMKQPSLRGSTGIGEIGYQYKKDETLKFDVGVKGYVGKQEGVSAQMAISIAF